MVLVRYMAQNTLLINGYKFKAGLNEVKDEDFYKMMNSKTFKFRVENGILKVPDNFPLTKKVVPVEVTEKQEQKKEQVSDKKEEDNEEEKEEMDKLSVKETLKLIESSDDSEYLKGLLESDKRVRVQDEVVKKLKSLKK